MTSRRDLGLALAALLLAACSASPPPGVPVAGDPGDLKALAGDWSGQYWSSQTGRSGTLRFQLSAEGDIARGDVTMTAAAATQRVAGEVSGETAAAGEQPTAQALSIRFVQVGKGEVHGAIDPYPDPSCGCILSTAFEGRVRGDVIEGTYTTQDGDAHARTGGKWRVERTKKEG